MASAICLIRSSLTLQANLFQLFQPIGGVFARPLSSARSSTADSETMNARQQQVRNHRQQIFRFIPGSSQRFSRLPGKTLRLWAFAERLGTVRQTEFHANAQRRKGHLASQ